MIKIIMFGVIAFVFAFVITTGFVNAQTATPTPYSTPTPQPTTSTTPGAPSTGFGQ